jgi:hypothetical protein
MHQSRIFNPGQYLHRQTLRLRNVAGPGRRPCRVSMPLRKACAPSAVPHLDDGTNPAPCGMGAQAPNRLPGEMVHNPSPDGRYCVDKANPRSHGIGRLRENGSRRGSRPIPPGIPNFQPRIFSPGAAR